MLSVPSSAAVYLYTAAADMRLGFDRLSEKVKSELKRDPLFGDYFVFFSRTRRKVRILYWDKDGYATWLKRLEAGAFKVEMKDGYEQVTGIDLHEVLAGIDLARIKLRKKVERGLYSDQSYVTKG
jgi:transposase